MTEFIIDPQSGFADSYLDVKFKVSFDKCERATVELFNETIGQQLEILSVGSGHIQGETKAIVKDSESLEGFVNLFNKDKMNSKLESHVYIEMRCKVTIQKGNHTVVDEKTARFYNESLSLDAGIVPFDIHIDNPHLDLRNNVPLSMTLISDIDKRYELCIMPPNGATKCTFEVLAKKGENQILLPSEVIWNDCGIGQYTISGLQLYWVKFEGIDHQRFRNRKYVPIDGTRLTFNTRDMQPKPQTRLGPTNAPLSKDFVVSDRYFVHTWKHFSSLGGLPEAFDLKRQHYLSRFLHEYQRLQQVDENIKLFEASEQKTGGKTKPLPMIAPERTPLNTLIMAAFSGVYNDKTSVMSVSGPFRPQPKKAKTAPRRRPQGGCGCSRKKQ
jgi:hypothetical protein